MAQRIALFTIAHHKACDGAQCIFQGQGVQIGRLVGQSQQVILSEGTQRASQQGEHLAHISFFQGGLLAPQFTLIFPPAIEVALIARFKCLQVFRLQTGGVFSSLPQVIHIEADQQGVAFGQTRQFSHDVHVAPQFIEREAHRGQGFGNARLV